MPVTFRCSECTQKLRIEDAFAGKLVSCVRCGAKQRVPLESSPEFAKPKPPVEAPKPVSRRDSPPVKPTSSKPPSLKPAEPKPPPLPKPPESKPVEPKSPKPLKPWQPSPVRQEPLPSELLSLREEPKPEEPKREKPRSEKPPRKTRKRETPPGELSFEALSAIFDEPITPEEPPSKDESPEHFRDEIREELLEGPREEDKPATAPDLSGELQSEIEQGGEDFEDEVPEYSSPEFEAAPLVAAGSKHFEEGFIPASFDAPQTTYLPEHQLEHPPEAAHAEPSMVPPAQKLDVEELIDMTAMVDIVFFLLIFFLVTSMHSLDSTIPMPTPDPQKGAAKEPQTVAAIDADDSYVVVRIDKNDKITVEGAEVRSERDLLFKLRDLRLAAARPEKLLVIGHGDATHGTAVMILDAGRELGMDQVKLTVQDEEE